MNKEEKALFDGIQSFNTKTYHEYLIPLLEVAPQKFTGDEVIKFIGDCLVDKDIEMNKYLKELDILRYENDDLKALNEGQAMRLKLCLEADIDEYVERIESLEKERLYFNSEFDKLKEQLTLSNLYLDAEKACRNSEAAFKEMYKKELAAIREAEKAILQKTIDLQKELNFSNIVRGEFLDEIDRLRLAVCQIKEMIEESEFEHSNARDKAYNILETVLAPAKKIND